jgi:hypothetical protein
MGRIIKALILGWIGKKVYDYTLGSETDEKAAPARRTNHAKRSAPKRKAA